MDCGHIPGVALICLDFPKKFGKFMVQPQKGRPLKKMEKRGRKENLTNAGKGRPRGTLNKFTSFKASLLQVYNDMGGDKAMCEWAMRRENQGEFYKLVAKLLPKEVELSGKDGGPVEIKAIEVTFVRPDKN